MLGIFARKNDHPLADDAEVRRIVDGLPALKPEAAVDEVATWLESLAALADFPAALRYQRVAEFDAATIAQARRLAREYYGGSPTTRFEEQKRWQRNLGYWTQLAAAYRRCLDDADSGVKSGGAALADDALFYARLLHAQAGRLRWLRLRYGTVDGALWQECGAIYLRAVGAGCDRRNVRLHGTPDSATTPLAEYLKALVFHASSLDNLTPQEIGIVERLIAHCLPHFVFSATPIPDGSYWIDAAKPQPPLRLVKAEVLTPSVRLIGAGRVLQEVAALRERIVATRQVPAELNLGGQYPPEVVLPVLEHLANCWSPTPPTRKHARHRIEGQVAIVAGLRAIHWSLGGGSALDESEQWRIEDISQGGMSAKLPLLRNDWVRVGAIVGMRPAGNPVWLVGAIRRFVRESESQGAAGIETLSKTPRALVASDGSFDTDIILLDGLRDDSAARILIAPGSWDPGMPLRVRIDGRSWRLHQDERLDAGTDWLLGRCVVEALPD